MSNEKMTPAPVILDPSKEIDIFLHEGSEQSRYQTTLAKLDKDQTMSYPFEEKELFRYSGQERDHFILDGLLTNLSAFVRQDENIVFEDEGYSDWKLTDFTGSTVVINRLGKNGFEDITLVGKTHLSSIIVKARFVCDPSLENQPRTVSKYSIILEDIENQEIEGDDSEDENVVYSSKERRIDKMTKEHTDVLLALLHNFNVSNKVPKIRRPDVSVSTQDSEDQSTDVSICKNNIFEAATRPDVDTRLIDYLIERLLIMASSSDSVVKGSHEESGVRTDYYEHNQFILLGYEDSTGAILSVIEVDGAKQGRCFSRTSGDYYSLESIPPDIKSSDIREKISSSRKPLGGFGIKDSDEAFAILSHAVGLLRTEQSRLK